MYDLSGLATRRHQMFSRPPISTFFPTSRHRRRFETDYVRTTILHSLASVHKKFFPSHYSAIIRTNSFKRKRSVGVIFLFRRADKRTEERRIKGMYRYKGPTRAALLRWTLIIYAINARALLNMSVSQRKLLTIPRRPDTTTRDDASRAETRTGAARRR